MKRSWILITLAVVVVMTTFLAYANCDNTCYPQMPKENEEIPSNASQTADETLNDTNDFACNLFRTIKQQKGGDGSIIVSPISVGYVLGMLGQGAEGETRRQITDVLGMGSSVKEINKSFKKIIDEAAKVDTTVTLNIANSIYVNSGFSIIPKYKDDMQKYYNALVDMLDFSSNSSVGIINNWCNTQTHGMIPKILDRLDPRDVMYLLNAVYFKASWTEEFDPKDTRNRYFTKQDGTVVEHKMMHLKIKAAYGQNDLYEMLCLPYGNGAYSMNVLLPNKGKTVDDVIQSLSAQKLEQQRLREMTTCNVDILMPSFTTESVTDLIKVLTSMGMPLAFTSSAQFTNMVVHEDHLWVNLMKQKARIEVNEKGTKAAAVTVAGLTKSTSANRPRSVTFHATRPFVYYIVDNSTGVIYFMGTYCGEEGEALTEISLDCTEGGFDPIVLPEVSVTPMNKRIESVNLPAVSVKRIGKSVEQEPQFPGGEAALMKYLRSHVNYPPMAAELGIGGRVIVQFVVDKTGKVGEVKVIHAMDYYLDREVVRLVKSLPRFTPGHHNGQPVDVWYVLPVNFD